MTVLPDLDAGCMSLVCDRCGALVTANGGTPDPEVVWPLLAQHGWTGSPFATGSHRCARCASAPPPAAHATFPPPRRPWRARTRVLPGTVVLTAYGDIGADCVEEFRARLTEGINASRHIVVDMTHANTLDPAGLAALVRAHNDAKRYGGVVCLAAPSRFVRTALHTMRLTAVFPTFDDSRTALAWLASHDRSGPSIAGSQPEARPADDGSGV